MNFLLTIYTTLGSYKFTIDASKGTCKGLIDYMTTEGIIIYELPYTLFKGAIMIGYVCEVITVT
jgi:hypothetical protein